MHPNDASGSPPTAADAVVVHFDVDAAGVLRFAGDRHDRGLRCTVGALRAALAVVDGPTVAVAPHGPPPPAGHTAPAATARPVTDAVKRVADGVIVRTVDRGPLRWVTAPAVLPRVALEAAVAGRADTDVVEPLTAVGPLEVLP